MVPSSFFSICIRCDSMLCCISRSRCSRESVASLNRFSIAAFIVLLIVVERRSKSASAARTFFSDSACICSFMAFARCSTVRSICCICREASAAASSMASAIRCRPGKIKPLLRLPATNTNWPVCAADVEVGRLGFGGCSGLRTLGRALASRTTIPSNAQRDGIAAASGCVSFGRSARGTKIPPSTIIGKSIMGKTPAAASDVRSNAEMKRPKAPPASAAA